MAHVVDIAVREETGTARDDGQRDEGLLLVDRRQVVLGVDFVDDILGLLPLVLPARNRQAVEERHGGWRTEGKIRA